jgi:ankyrin repeat protein
LHFKNKAFMKMIKYGFIAALSISVSLYSMEQAAQPQPLNSKNTHLSTLVIHNIAQKLCSHILKDKARRYCNCAFPLPFMQKLPQEPEAAIKEVVTFLTTKFPKELVEKVILMVALHITLSAAPSQDKQIHLTTLLSFFPPLDINNLPLTESAETFIRTLLEKVFIRDNNITSVNGFIPSNTIPSRNFSSIEGGSFNTLLHLAAHLNNTTVIRFLLSLDASINQATDQSCTALHFAAANDSNTAIKELCQYDDLKSTKTRTWHLYPLNIAVNRNNILAVGPLLSRASWEELESTLYGLLSMPGNLEISRQIFTRIATHPQYTTLPTRIQFYIAIATHQDSIITQHNSPFKHCLWSSEIDKPEELCNFNTALHIAALFDNAEIIPFLLKKGASSEVTNSKGQTPLFSALLAKSIEAARILLDNKARVDVCDRSGYYPLGYALDSLPLTTLLVEKGASLELLYEEQNPVSIQNTALHVASIYGQADVVQFLLSQGANRRKQNGLTQTPLMLAIQRGSHMIGSNKTIKGLYLYKISDNHLKTVVTLLNYGKDAYTENEKYDLLQQAIDDNNTMIVSALVESNLAPNIIRKALLYAFDTGKDNLVPILFDKCNENSTAIILQKVMLLKNNELKHFIFSKLSKEALLNFFLRK